MVVVGACDTTHFTIMASSGPPPLEVHLLSSLRKRNALEVDALRPVVESYLRILGDKTLLRKECSQLDKRTKALAEEKETLKRELLHKDDNEGKAAMAEKLTRKNAELGEEVLQSYKENARIAQELAAKVSEVTFWETSCWRSRKTLDWTSCCPSEAAELIAPLPCGSAQGGARCSPAGRGVWRMTFSNIGLDAAGSGGRAGKLPVRLVSGGGGGGAGSSS